MSVTCYKLHASIWCTLEAELKASLFSDQIKENQKCIWLVPGLENDSNIFLVVILSTLHSHCFFYFYNHNKYYYYYYYLLLSIKLLLHIKYISTVVYLFFTFLLENCWDIYYEKCKSIFSLLWNWQAGSTDSLGSKGPPWKLTDLCGGRLEIAFHGVGEITFSGTLRYNRKGHFCFHD